MMSATRISTPWLATLNFAKGVSYVVVMVISLLMFRQMGLSVAETTALAALGYLPWVLKCWWKPWTQRMLSPLAWVLLTELLLVVTFTGMAFAFPTLWHVVLLLQLTAWLTAIHNVASDSLSSTATEKPRHRLTRELSRKFAVVIGQGVLVMLAGNLQVFYRHDMLYAWRLMFYLVAGLFLLLFFCHTLLQSGAPKDIIQNSPPRGSWRGALPLFLYPLSQAMIGKVSILFLIDTGSSGGLGLSPQEFGLVMGTVGIIALTVGGLLGTKAIRRFGFATCLWPMTASMFLPGIVYVALSYYQPDNLPLICLGVLVEQMGYGFGFALYLWLLRRISWREQGKSLMALSLMVGTVASGQLQQVLGYNGFFVTALVLSALTVASALMIRKIPTNK